MSATFDTFCITCDASVAATTEIRNDEITIRGEKVQYQAIFCVCPTCNSNISDSRIEKTNLNAAMEAYRASHNLITCQQISDLRAAMGLSIREFSRFFGFGEQTTAKYEKGTLPDTLHSNTMKMAFDPIGATFLLDLNQANLSLSSIASVRSYIERISHDDGAANLRHGIIRLSASKAPSKTNGYREFDTMRLAAVVVMLASACRNLFKTKLQKALFFCDFCNFERAGRSLTGLTYAHADHGPVMDQYEYHLIALKNEGYIEEKPQGWGTIILPSKPVPAVFDSDEIELVREVSCFVDSFESATDLSDYSHTLEAWSRTRSGELIPYGINFGEVSEAVSRRFAELKEDATRGDETLAHEITRTPTTQR